MRALDVEKIAGSVREAAARYNANQPLNEPELVYLHLRKYWGKRQEHFVLICLDKLLAPIKTKVITIGVLDRSLVHPREVFHAAIMANASSIIIAHNHPSGSTEPGADDIATTKRLVQAGELLGIPVLDHLVIAKTGFYSFQENRML
jgi:DNA repair protein RadC